MPLRDYRSSIGARPKRPAHGPSTFKIVSLAILLGLLVVAGGWLYWIGKTSTVRTDPETLCPVDRRPSEALVILLDLSDRLDEPQNIQILNELERVRASVPRWGLVEVYEVEPNTDFPWRDRLGLRLIDVQQGLLKKCGLIRSDGRRGTRIARTRLVRTAYCGREVQCPKQKLADMAPSQHSRGPSGSL